MGFDVSFDSRNWNAMVRDLASLEGAVDYQTALELQTGVLLNKCADLTQKRSVAEIERSVKFHNRNLWERSQRPGERGKSGNDPVIVGKLDGTMLFVDRSTFSGPSGNSKQPTKLIHGKSFHQMNSPMRRWSDERWGRYQDALAKLKAQKINLAAAKRARGLAARSWVQIADELGIDLMTCGGKPPPSYVRNAKPARGSGSDYINGRGHRIRSGDTFWIEIINDYPALADPLRTRGKVNGYEILQRAMDARAYAFATDMAHDVFESMARRAKRYPGIFVS